MVGQANTSHIQGHEMNMEGQLRLSVPASFGSVGKCIERKEFGREVCSRKSVSENGQYGHQNKSIAGATVADKMVDDRKNGDGCIIDMEINMINPRIIVPRQRRLSEGNVVGGGDNLAQHGRAGGIANAPFGVVNQNNEDDHYEGDQELEIRPLDAFNDGLRYDGGGGDRVQDLFEDREPFEKPIVDEQNRQIVLDAADIAQRLKVAIVDANDMLETMRKNGSKISNELVANMELHMTNSVRFLADQVEQQDTLIEQLLATRTTLEEEVERLAEERSQMVQQIALERSARPGLSDVELLQLERWGIKDIHELFNQYRLLQVQVKHSNILSRSSSKISLSSTQLESCQPQAKGGFRFTSLGNKDNESKIKPERQISGPKFPKLEKFKGKTRTDLERFFRYFEPFAKSLSLGDADKALYIGYYLPDLQYQHDSLMQRNATYAEVKRELLNALGSDSEMATYSLRTALDKITKPADKSYRKLFEEIERKVAEAYGSDQVQREQELKKILLRLTQEDPDSAFSSTTLPHTGSDYYRLKELVLGTEDANKLRKQNVDSRKALDRKPVAPPQKFSAGGGSRYNTSKTWNQHSSDNYRQNTTVPPSYNQPSTVPQRYPGDSQQRSSGVVGNFKREQDNSRPSLKCYECQASGHMVKDCPKRAEAQMVQHQDARSQLEFSPDEEHGPSFSVSGIVPINCISKPSQAIKFFGDKTLLETRFDGVKIVSMLDSGACVSVINDKALDIILRDKNRFGKITREKEESYKNNGLIGANGSKLNVLDCVRIPISWGDYAPAPAIFFVVAGLQQDVLIGTNVLKNNPVWMHALEYALNAKTAFQQKAALSTSSKINPNETINQNGSFVGSVGWNVTTAEYACVPPQTMQFVKVRTPFSDKPSLVESSKSCIETGVIRSRRGFAWVECRNHSNEPLVIHKNESIGEAWPIKIVETVDDCKGGSPVNVVTDPKVKIINIFFITNVNIEWSGSCQNCNRFFLILILINCLKRG